MDTPSDGSQCPNPNEDFEGFMVWRNGIMGETLGALIAMLQSARDSLADPAATHPAQEHMVAGAAAFVSQKLVYIQALFAVAAMGVDAAKVASDLYKATGAATATGSENVAEEAERWLAAHEDRPEIS